MTDPTPQTTPTRDEAVLREICEEMLDMHHGRQASMDVDAPSFGRGAAAGWDAAVSAFYKAAVERVNRATDAEIGGIHRSFASAPAPASGGVDVVAEAIGTSEFMDPPDGGDVPLAEQVRRMSEAYKQRGKDIVALMAAIDAEKAGCRQERAARMAFLGAAREALNTSGLTREQVIIADNSISEAFRRVREEARHVD